MKSPVPADVRALIAFLSNTAESCVKAAGQIATADPDNLERFASDLVNSAKVFESAARRRAAKLRKAK